MPTVAGPARPLPGLGKPVNRLAGIDGLRAVAALWVVVFHGMLASQLHLASVPGFSLVAASGWKGVSLFFVLSGFCLYLPLAKRPRSLLEVATFFRRRARRILPAYYLSLGGVAVFHLLLERRVGGAQLGLGGTLLHTALHATMLHTVVPSAFNSLNGVYWSLGVEWELYLVFPLLVWVAARFGFAAAFSLAAAVNVAWLAALQLGVEHGVLPNDPVAVGTVMANQFPGRWLEFALGMLAATLVARGHAARVRRLWPAAVAALVLVLFPRGLLINVLTGLLFFVVVLVVAAGGNPLARLMSTRPLVLVGTVSFSLYLVHEPILNSVARIARARGDGPIETLLMLVAALPIVAAATLVVFAVAERPFLRPGRDVRAERVSLSRDVTGDARPLPATAEVSAD